MASAPGVTFAFTDAQLADLSRVLNPKQLERAVYAAVSRTTNRARAIATNAVQDRLTVPRKYIDDPDNRYSAIRARVDKSGDAPVGRLIVREQQLPMSAFKFRATKKGVTVTFDKKTPPVALRHAFAATVKSKRQEALGVAHKGIFLRQRVSAGNAARYFQKNKLSSYRTAKSNAITPKGFAWRLPIGELFGPSILDFISRREIRDAVLSQIGDELDRQLDSQVSRFTKGKSSTLDAAVAALGLGDAGDPNAANDNG